MINYGEVTKFYGLKFRNLHIPFSGSFELTPRCNMNCKMCYIRMDEKEMEKVGHELPVEEWIRIAREAVAAGMTMVLLTGGEAILYKGFKQFYLELRKMGVLISINTNGTLFNDKWIEFFRENPPLKFNITIYGGSNETYAQLCGNPSGFDQLKRNVELLQSNGFDIMLNCTITKQNMHDMENIFNFGREHNLTVHTTTYNFPPVRKEGIDDPALSRMTATEAAKARIFLNWCAVHNDTKFKLSGQATLNQISQAHPTEDDCGEIVGDRVLCAAGRSNFWVTWDGRMLPCGMLPDMSFPLRDRPFKDVWQKVVAETGKITLAPECKRCKKNSICKPCAAKLKSETGFYDQKAPYLCQYQDEYIRLLGEAKKYLEQNS